MAELTDKPRCGQPDRMAYEQCPAVSNSEVGLFIEDPALYKMYREGTYERESTWSMDLGTMIHDQVFVPEKVDERYAILNEDMKTPGSPQQEGFVNLVLAGMDAFEAHQNSYKSKLTDPVRKAQSEALLRELDEYINFYAEHGTKTHIPVKQYQIFQRLMANLEDHPEAKHILMGDVEIAFNEQPILFEIEGLPMKGIVDRISVSLSERIIQVTDLKTTSAALSSFGEKYKMYGYDRQQALYNIGAVQWLRKYNIIEGDGWTLSTRCVAAHTGQSGSIRVFRPHPDLLTTALNKAQTYLKVLNECMEANRWLHHQVYHPVITIHEDA